MESDKMIKEKMMTFFKESVCNNYCSVKTPSEVYSKLNTGKKISRANVLRSILKRILKKEGDKYSESEKKLIIDDINKPNVNVKLGGSVLIKSLDKKVRIDGGENKPSRSLSVHLPSILVDEIDKIVFKTKESRSSFAARWVKYGIEHEKAVLAERDETFVGNKL